MDLGGALPASGTTTVLEASAGTGKTWTIAGLVCRYVAEGHARIDELLAVTFGRAATSELRTRVRDRMVAVHDALAGDDVDSLDPVVRILATRDRELHRERLATALASFDGATITTIHGFCEQVLRSLGTLSDLDPGTTLVDSLDDVVSEAASDLFLAHSLSGAARADFTPDVAMAIATAAIRSPDAAVLPVGAARDSLADVRVRFATAVRDEVERRKRRFRVLTYDDQLSRARAALCDPATGSAACARLRERFKVVLVDEFQDTDPIQWDIFRTAFHGHRTLVVIGDPKQAIYAFRGADVNAYLEARRHAHHTASLDTNWRSDERVVRGISRLLRNAALGHADIRVSAVKAGHTTTVVTPAGDAPVRLRVVPRTLLYGKHTPYVGPVRVTVARDVARQVATLLSEDLEVSPREGATRAFNARDIAVLVRTSAQAERVREALEELEIPCVLSGTQSVFASHAARDWICFLDALEQPQNRGRVRRFALTPFIGLRAVDLADDAGVKATDRLAMQLRGWAQVLADKGVAGLFAAVRDERGLTARLLALEDGERAMTDLRHVAEVLHRQGVTADLGLAGLVSWLRERVEDTNDQNQERSRRLETERAVVQVLTVHASKGLEFPVVLVPFGWDTAGGRSKERFPRGHDDAGRRTVFVAGSEDRAAYDQACEREDVESAGEELRLLYVALTRAVSRLIVWWAPSKNTETGPLNRLLFCEDPIAMPPGVPLLSDVKVLAHLTELAAGEVAVETVEDTEPPSARTPLAVDTPLALAEFTRALDLSWHRTSYSGVTRDLYHARVTSEAEPVKDDEPDVVITGDGEGAPSLWNGLQGGASFGTRVHAVLELADLAVQPIEDELVRAGAWPELVTALVPSIQTPVIDGRSLQDIPLTDQLRELDFELPLAGGNDPTGEVRLSQLPASLRTLPDDDPVRPYANVLEASPIESTVLRGYLAGSIDVVLRVDGRFYVADYKTNNLAPEAPELTTWHYRPAALDRAMLEAHYPLQALFYGVALHRYLRWRLPDYSPDEHLGGVRYLFLRGMCGPDAEGGVWSWRPPTSLITGLSNLLAGLP
jgi:exodeoxyribonuclease V beta subunit